MNPRMRNGRSANEGERGSAFFVVTVMAITATVLVGAYLSSSLGKVRHVERELASRSAFNAAESGLNAMVESLWALYRAAPPENRVASLDEFDGKNAEDERLRIEDAILGRSRFTARVERVLVSAAGYADVEIVSTGSNSAASRTISAVVRYGHEPSEVFDHAYFINNYGWLWGAGITVNGSVRSNGNFSLKNPVVNGDIYAAENPELGATGTIEGDFRYDDVDYYNEHEGTTARPTSPSAPPEDANGNGVLDAGEDVNGNGVLDDFANEDGYDGSPEKHEGLPPIEMPYLGDLSTYKNLAIEKGGSISQGGSTIVSGVFGDQSSESGHVIMVGTADNPIVLDGPVVVTGDVVLRGYITGQGTIYAGRNVHLIGDLKYVNPPSWPKPSTDPEGDAQANAGKDLVGLAARGSVILGDYTVTGWQSTTRNYQKPPFTQAYKVHPADADIGYVTHYDSEGNPMFNGDYTANDGGQKGVDTGELVSRKYYESSFSDDLVHSLADEQVKHVDAVLYTNHMLTGKVGSAVFNGTLVSRDEAIIYNGSLDINYDVRVRSGDYAFLDSFLPREPNHQVLYWKEGQ